MATGQVTDRTMTEDEVGRQWAQVVAEVAGEKTRVIVEQDGKPVAAVISAEDLERYKRLVAEDQERFRALLERMRAPFRDKSDEEIMEDVARIIEEVRAEERKKAASGGSPS